MGPILYLRLAKIIWASMINMEIKLFRSRQVAFIKETYNKLMEMWPSRMLNKKASNGFRVGEVSVQTRMMSKKDPLSHSIGEKESHPAKEFHQVSEFHQAREMHRSTKRKEENQIFNSKLKCKLIKIKLGPVLLKT